MLSILERSVDMSNYISRFVFVTLSVFASYISTLSSPDNVTQGMEGELFYNPTIESYILNWPMP